MPRAVVIGAGVAGLATAIRLQIKGYQVEVYEANAYPGGKLHQQSWSFHGSLQKLLAWSRGIVICEPPFVSAALESTTRAPGHVVWRHNLAVETIFCRPSTGFHGGQTRGTVGNHGLEAEIQRIADV